MWREYQPPELCFTAEQANSTVTLEKNGSPTAVTLETSTDGTTWDTYTFGNTITLSNIGDKVYRRNTSETATGFSTSTSDYYRFVLTGLIGASGDTNSLLCKNSTDTLISQYCFYRLFYYQEALTKSPKLPGTTLKPYGYHYMFYNCLGLTTAPSLPATVLGTSCYDHMFGYCKNLTEIPMLPATSISKSCYNMMFYSCSKIKLSSTQTGEYQTPYRIPTTGTGLTGTGWNSNMFYESGGTFTGSPTIDTTYYTSNTVV